MNEVKIRDYLEGMYDSFYEKYIWINGIKFLLLVSSPGGYGIVINPRDTDSPDFATAFAEAKEKFYAIEVIEQAKHILGYGIISEDPDENHDLFCKLHIARQQVYYSLPDNDFYYVPDEFLADIEFAMILLKNGLPAPPRPMKPVAEPPKPTPKPGFIYILKAITPDNHYKIGRSKDPVNRIETMGVKLPFPLEPIHQFPTSDASRAEKQLHEQYEDKRVNGEWFALSDSDVETICQIERMDFDEEQS